MQKRVLNHRDNYEFKQRYKQYNVAKPDLNDGEYVYNVTTNFYPVNYAIQIKDGNKSFTVMNDRTQGGSSLKNGQIQLMQNRRLFSDDGKGIGADLNEVDTTNYNEKEGF